MDEQNPGLPGASFDRWARMVRRVLGVPHAMVSIEATGSPLVQALCNDVVSGRQPLFITDTRDHPRLRGPRTPADPGVVAYAGWPLTDHRGRTVGSLCAVDVTPRDWTPEERAALEDLAGACSAEIAQRELRSRADDDQKRGQSLLDRGRVLLALSEALAATRTLSDVAGAVQAVALEHLGCLHAGLWLRTLREDETRLWRLVSEPVEQLRFVPTERDDWVEAAKIAQVPADATTPMGDVHQTRVARFFPDRHAQAVIYPHLPTTAADGEARAFLPLTVARRPLGALVLTWPGARTLSEDDRSTIGALATYTAQAAERALLLAERVETALVLQDAMLTEIPRIDGLDIAARYLPAAVREQVGGDWYDAFVLRSGSVVLIIGDVVGHDIQAAAHMGQLRSMLRAYAWADDGPPSRAVERLDQAINGLRLDALATLVYARLDPDTSGAWTLTWTCAGHPPPVAISPTGRSELLQLGRPGPLVGAAPEVSRDDNSIRLSPGATLILYTDGLIERRHELLDIGMERLSRAAAQGHRLSLDHALDRIIDDLDVRHPTDDVAVIAVRLTGSSDDRRGEIAR
ncbi:SpoIIE family protein phosphatase [Nocardioides sp. CER19]|nr:GAF domain-containing SpoIIE family protein phosphatase [Nocardioides sp. CER19]MDH2415599.1 SpoIIE family protein phosphatase [Nocardioides sp. CER19]